MNKYIEEYCMRINGEHIFYPLYNEQSQKEIKPTREMAKKYGINNGVLAFVTEKSDFYITPFCNEVGPKLTEEGYENGHIPVPFSNGDVPGNPEKALEWEKMCIDAKKKQRQADMIKRQMKLKEIAERRGIKELPKEIYLVSHKIPSEGIETTMMGQDKNVTYPIPFKHMEQCEGCFYINNGKLAFVDNKGETYVTPFCFEVGKTLTAYGYKQNQLYVPFSNGEQITDTKVADKWNKMCSEARKQINLRKEKELKAYYSKIASKRELSKLPNEVYMLSLKIPKSGFTTTWLGQDKGLVKPISKENIPESMGKFSINNGKISFVDTNGDTYVSAFADHVSELLINAGFKNRPLIVPLSNGEQIEDLALADKWNKMCKKALEISKK